MLHKIQCNSVFGVQVLYVCLWQWGLNLPFEVISHQNAILQITLHHIILANRIFTSQRVRFHPVWFAGIVQLVTALLPTFAIKLLQGVSCGVLCESRKLYPLASEYGLTGHCTNILTGCHKESQFWRLISWRPSHQITP